MKRTFAIYGALFSVICWLVIPGCGTTDANDDPPPPTNDNGDSAVTYSLSTAVIPEEAGSVVPESGEFEEGEEVTVEATVNDGWEFENWSGDIESTDNPLSFTIEEDVDVTANFRDRRSMYSVDLTVSDSKNSLELAFGQAEGASDEFDSGLDQEAPPPPPAGALHAWFERNGEELFADFRSRNDRDVIWNLKLQSGEEDFLILNWVIDVIQMDGWLMLYDNSDPDNANLVVDMLEENSVEINTDELDSLYIRYQLQ